MKDLKAYSIQSKQFIKAVLDFISLHKLLPEGRDLLLAVSGGADSTALMPIAFELQKQRPGLKVRVFSLHHNGREGQDEEVKSVASQAGEFGFDFLTSKLEANNKGAENFEAWARQKRRELLLQKARPNEVIFTGHHLDDSYEWSLMQSSRSSRVDVLGIPLVNGKFRRPFLCAQKSQILAFLKDLKLSHCEDPSNLDISFERNYVRHEVIPKLKKRYPKLLKHYVHRSNLMAHKLGLHVHKLNDQAVTRRWARGQSLQAADWSARYDILRVETLRQLVHELAPGHRGELTDELFKVLFAMRNGRKGPHQVGPKVLAYLWGKEIFLLRKSDLAFYRETDAGLYNSCAQTKASQIHWLVKDKHLPIKIQNPKNKDSLKAVHPLFPKFCELLQQNGLGWQTPARVDSL